MNDNPIGTMTLAQIKACAPCDAEWQRGLACFASPPDLNTRISLGDIAHHLDENAAWWCVRALNWEDVHVRRSIAAAFMPAVRRATVHKNDAQIQSCIRLIQLWIDADDTVDLKVLMNVAVNGAREALLGDSGWAVVMEAARAVLADSIAPLRMAVWTMRTPPIANARTAAISAARRRTESERQRQELIAAFPPLHPMRWS